ncbi:MAG: glucans biosynthesis glucosyltransferase MdoH [Verrucomicrobia bacterium]|jgi:membrane glycosyltransferase|nr:glucans biosynthesis glucosyltransferase MdoH [Verrucomicrobiota bacterium]
MTEADRQADFFRRGIFYTLVLGTIFVLTWMFADLLWRVDFSMLNTVLVILFSVLAYPIAVGFWQSFFGVFHRNRFKSGESGLAEDWQPEAHSIAVNIPVYNEDIEMVLARVRALYDSLKKTGYLEAFDFYLLSDSNKPGNWVNEEYGWARLCRQLDAYDRIFYRRRKLNLHQKAGNLLNFCESWGRRYKYMVILDADSLMSGEALIKMARQMEARPKLGILQRVPELTRGRSRYALMQQFSNHIYGPLFSRGLAFWQGGKGNYWGHNAIIRVEPFIRHCALPDLPGRPPLGGKILSHDFVEAALMVRAGYEVRMNTESSGSYEEGPADLLENAARDRRWCQGNMQHIWLLFADRIHWASKCHFINGIFSYVGSFLWLLFLMISIALAFEWKQSNLSIIAVQGTSPLGALSITQHGVLLFVIIMGLLLFPKLLGVLRGIILPSVRRSAGGVGPLVFMAFMELLLSSLIAPVQMIFHSRFVLLTLFGKGIGWTAQSRDSRGLAWLPSLRSVRLQTVTGILVMLIALRIGIPVLLWLSPIWLGLLLASWLVTWTSRPANSKAATRFQACSESSEIEPVLERIIEKQDLRLRFFTRTGGGLENAVVDPMFNAIHLSILEYSHKTDKSPCVPGEGFFKQDPRQLDPEEQMHLLESPDCMKDLHRLVWRLPESRLHPRWRAVLERYTLKPVFNP